jgi:ABC-type cobalamin transport system permease subunit
MQFPFAGSALPLAECGLLGVPKGAGVTITHHDNAVVLKTSVHGENLSLCILHEWLICARYASKLRFAIKAFQERIGACVADEAK